MPLRNPIKWVWQATDRGLNTVVGAQNVWQTMTVTPSLVQGILRGGIRITSIRVRQINDEVAVKDLDVRLTIDGYVLAISIAALLNDTFTSIQLRGIVLYDTADPAMVNFMWTDNESESFDCSSLLGEMRITSALGTNQVMELELICSMLG